MLFIAVLNALLCVQLRGKVTIRKITVSLLHNSPATYLALAGLVCAFLQIRGMTTGGPYDNSVIFHMWLLIGIAQWSANQLFGECLRNTAAESLTQSTAFFSLMWKIITAIGLLMPFVATPSF